MARHYQAKQQRSRFETLLGPDAAAEARASETLLALARRRDACGLKIRVGLGQGTTIPKNNRRAAPRMRGVDGFYEET